MKFGGNRKLDLYSYLHLDLDFSVTQVYSLQLAVFTQFVSYLLIGVCK